MSKKLLINIKQDPRKSHKPLEGLRIAAALLTSNISVTVNISKYKKLFENNKFEEIVDGFLFFQYVQVLKEYNCLDLNRMDKRKERDSIVLNF